MWHGRGVGRGWPIDLVVSSRIGGALCKRPLYMYFRYVSTRVYIPVFGCIYIYHLSLFLSLCVSTERASLSVSLTFHSSSSLAVLILHRRVPVFAS